MNKSLLRFLTFAAFVLVVAVLRVAEAVLIPIALATLLAFLLTPLVVRFQRMGIPKIPAVAIGVAFAFTIAGVVAWVVALQLIDLAEKLPNYERNIQAKIESLQKPQQPAAIQRMVQMIDNLRADIKRTEDAARDAEARREGGPPPPAPVPVEVQPTEPSPIETLQRFVGPFLGPLGTGGIVVVLLVAMLLQREDLRDRFIKVVSAGRINVATQAVDDAARRVSRYLFLQLVVNATYGIPVGIGLYLIGIPNALLWGLLATVLRFIPFLGPWIAALFPVALAAAVAPGWEQLVYTILLFVVMELISNNIVEVWLYGSGTGISNLALLVAAVFWTWVWGPIGLFLSTPLTVCLLVLGKYVPGLRFLSMLLGSEPVLEPPAQFYQRMLAMDFDAMLDLALDTVKKRSVVDFYDSVYVPALILAEQDRHRGALAEVRQRFIFESGRELIDELERRGAEADDENDDDAKTTEALLPGARADERFSNRVFIVPARDDADELVAAMLQHLLRDRGAKVDVAPVTTSTADWLSRIHQRNYDTVVVSSLPPSSVAPARRLGRLLRDEFPRLRLLIGIWSEEAHVSDLHTRLRLVKPDGVATRIGELMTLLARAASAERALHEAPGTSKRGPTPPSESPPPLELDGIEPEAVFEAVTRDLAQHFDVPVSLVSVVDFDRAFWAQHKGLPRDLLENPQHDPLPAPPMNGEDFAVVEDLGESSSSAPLPPLFAERGIRFYACAALRHGSGQSVGTLCVVDTKPRKLTAYEAAVLRQRAAEFMDAVEKATVSS